MKATDLIKDGSYEIKGRQGTWTFVGKKWKEGVLGNYGKYDGYVLIFINSKGNTFDKISAAGVKQVTAPVAVVKDHKSILPKHNEYDRLHGYTELVATFLRTIGIEGGVIDVEHEGHIVPTVFVFPSYVSRLQELIKKVNLTNLTTETPK